MAYILEFEWQRAKLDERAKMAEAPLRVTMIFEKKDGAWKVTTLPCRRNSQAKDRRRVLAVIAVSANLLGR